MELEIRDARPNDFARILEMMRDFADFVGLSDYLTISEERLSQAVFGPGAFVELMVAIRNGAIAGYAIIYPHFSSFRGERGFYLEDIYVDESSRREGVGLALLRAMARRAAERGFERIDFQVLKSNAGAIRFYEALGAESNDEERHFKFAGDAFARLSGE
jgi:ribosomal protein S18 acetylase RimI-like enzyme